MKTLILFSSICLLFGALPMGSLAENTTNLQPANLSENSAQIDSFIEKQFNLDGYDPDDTKEIFKAVHLILNNSAGAKLAFEKGMQQGLETPFDNSDLENLRIALRDGAPGAQIKELLNKWKSNSNVTLSLEAEKLVKLLNLKQEATAACLGLFTPAKKEN